MFLLVQGIKSDDGLFAQAVSFGTVLDPVSAYSAQRPALFQKHAEV